MDYKKKINIKAWNYEVIKVFPYTSTIYLEHGNYVKNIMRFHVCITANGNLLKNGVDE